MSTHRETKVVEEITHAAAEYFARESNGKSLITITRAELSPNQKSMTIFFSVLPEAQEENALNFAKRQRSEFKDYVRKNTRIGMIPMIDFEIDFGEKNRQRIDELTGDVKREKGKL